MTCRTKRRRGVSLLELLVVVSILGIVASIAIMRYGRTTLADFGSKAQCRQLSMALLRAQRASIKSGDNHFLQFDRSNGASTFELRRRTTNGSTVLIEGPVALSADVTVNVSHSTMEFTFEGGANAAYRIDLIGANQQWRLNVIPVNGSVEVVEL